MTMGWLLKQAGHATCAQARRRASKSRKRPGGPIYDEAVIIDSKVSACPSRPVCFTEPYTLELMFLAYNTCCPRRCVLTGRHASQAFKCGAAKPACQHIAWCI